MDSDGQIALQQHEQILQSLCSVLHFNNKGKVPYLLEFNVSKYL
jgi:hypothetical protein